MVRLVHSLFSAENVTTEKSCLDSSTPVYVTESQTYIQCSEMATYPMTYYCSIYGSECCQTCQDVGKSETCQVTASVYGNSYGKHDTRTKATSSVI